MLMSALGLWTNKEGPLLWRRTPMRTPQATGSSVSYRKWLSQALPRPGFSWTNAKTASMTVGLLSIWADMIRAILMRTALWTTRRATITERAVLLLPMAIQKSGSGKMDVQHPASDLVNFF